MLGILKKFQLVGGGGGGCGCGGGGGCGSGGEGGGDGDFPAANTSPADLLCPIISRNRFFLFFGTNNKFYNTKNLEYMCQFHSWKIVIQRNYL